MNKDLQNSIQSSKIFTRFKKIPDKAYHDFYYFYQFYLPQISTLGYDEYIEIKFNYIKALFHLDKYHQFYQYSDELISEVLNHQTFEAKFRSIYEQVLFYKAEAFYNENKRQAAQAIYVDLMRLNADNKIYKRKLFYLLFQNEQIRNRKNVAIVVLFILLSLFCTGISIFVVQPFFAQWVSLIELSRNILFACGILGFIIIQGIQFKSSLTTINSLAVKQQTPDQQL
jgi:hypothetical protein